MSLTLVGDIAILCARRWLPFIARVFGSLCDI
jgi:hypothetical protein